MSLSLSTYGMGIMMLLSFLTYPFFEHHFFKPQTHLPDTSPQGLLSAFLQRFYASMLLQPPLNPIFADGGALAGYNEDIFLLSASLVCIFIFDQVTSRAFKIREDARWFFLHACCNIAVFTAGFECVVKGFQKPTLSFHGSSLTALPSAIAVACHLYHCLPVVGWWNDLSGEDIFHHCAFVFLMEFWCIAWKHGTGPWGANAAAAILSGLPGSLNYILLVLWKYDKISKLQERRYANICNAWLRNPLASLYAFMGYTCWVEGTFTGSDIGLIVGGSLFFWNGVHYSNEVAQSLGRHEERERAKRKAEKAAVEAAAATARSGNEEPASPLSPVENSLMLTA